MSARLPQRRGQTPNPLSLTPNPKPTISLEEWESKTKLSDLQIRTVNLVKEANEKVPLPFKFLAEEREETSLPRPAGKFLQQAGGSGTASGSSSRPSTPQITAGRTPHALHPSQPVQTPQQFYDWYALIDRSVAHSQEAHYRAHVASISEHLETCRLLVNRLDEIDRAVDEMLEGWRGVEEGGKSLKDACERLLEERDNLLELMEDIGGHLEYFQELEHATRMLNHPGETLIFQGDFLYMVERVDICIDFLKNRRHYREAEVYLLRFQQCMTRAMTLIKMNFVGSLRALSSEVAKRLSEKDVSTTAQSHLLYTRFKSVSSRIAPLLGELERRAQSYPDELSALLAECQAAYFSTRRALLVPRIMEEIRGLDPGRSELVELARSGCSYLKQLCTDEFYLYREFFSTAEDQLYQYLETLCDLLYDDLRPRILHEPRLTVLCEVCTVLQALMVLDASSSSIVTPSTGTFPPTSATSQDPSSEDDENDGDLSLTFNSRQTPGNKSKVGKRLHTSHLLNMVLQDAQTRLFFKAQSVIQSEIRGYVPKAEDLGVRALVAARNPASVMDVREKESVSELFRASSLDKQETWYPTLRKTVWVLAQLHDFVKPSIFQEIAHEALTYCLLSLVSASELVNSRPGPSQHSNQQQRQAHDHNQLDAALFLARHLVILKDILRSLEAQLERGRAEESSFSLGSPRDVGREWKEGGGGMTETFTNMLNRTTSLLPEGLITSLGVSRAVGTMGESDLRGVGSDIDQNLRKTCEDVIAACANPICEPLEAYITRMGSSSSKSLSAASPPSAVPLSGPPSSSTLQEEIQSMTLTFLESINRDLRSNVARVRLYLEDERTIKVLLDHVQDRIGDVYGEFLGVIEKARLKVGRGEGNAGDGDMLSMSALRELMKGICVSGMSGGGG